MTKRCSKCKEVKPKSLFNKSSTAKSGCQSQCAACRKATRETSEAQQVIKRQKKRYYEENKSEILLTQKESRAKNPDRFKEADARKYLKNRDKILTRVSEYQKVKPEVNRKASKKYRDSNLHLGAAKTAKRRSRLRKATPKWIDDEFEQLFLVEIFHLAYLRKELTGIEYHVDHIVPLTSKKVCGLHCMSNLQLLPAKDNIAKSNLFWPDMWTEEDFNILTNKIIQGELNGS